jgi:hypothetical protein
MVRVRDATRGTEQAIIPQTPDPQDWHHVHQAWSYQPVAGGARSTQRPNPSKWQQGARFEAPVPRSKIPDLRSRGNLSQSTPSQRPVGQDRHHRDQDSRRPTSWHQTGGLALCRHSAKVKGLPLTSPPRIFDQGSPTYPLTCCPMTSTALAQDLTPIGHLRLPHHRRQEDPPLPQAQEEGQDLNRVATPRRSTQQRLTKSNAITGST